jgi:NAD(P)-dependent dehydrogenase (short-subunit alcohol dehydrogenase family)
VALLTGGASGIGRASVLALSGAGAAVAVLDRDEAGATAGVAQVKNSGGHAFVIVNDLSHTERILNSVASVLRESGRIDFLINCAGVARKF